MQRLWWRKKKCNICFHAFNVHKGVTIGDNDECYIDGVLSVSGGGASASASPPAAAAGGAGSAGFTSPIAERQQAFTHFQQQPKASPTAAHAHAPAAASEPASAPAASQPEKVVMVTSPVASGPPRRFAAPGSKAAASPAAAAPANAAAAPASTTVPAGGASSLSVPASVEASSAAHPSASSSGSKPSSKPASRASSKPGSRRGSVTKATVPGMIAEAKPYYVKALYSHVGTIPEQLSFKRNELLLIDGAMEGWLSASVLNEPERRGWIPSNYIERLPEGSVPSNLTASSKNKSKSRRGSTNANDAATTTPQKNKTAATASTKTEATPGPAIEHHMSASHHTGETSSERVLLEALYDFAAEEPDQQLSFQKGDLFTLVSREDPDWWDVRADESGAVGAVPALYMRELAKPAGSPIAPMTSAAATATGPEKTPATVAAATPEKAKPAASVAATTNGTHVAAASEATPEKKEKSAPSSRRGSEKKSTPVKTKENEAAPSSASSSTAAAAPVTDAAAPAKDAAPAEPSVAAAEPAAASAAPSIPAGATHRASFPFEGTVEGQLSYAAGDYLALIAKEFEAWWRFKHCASGNEGLVAATYVADLSEEELKSAAAGAAAEPAKPAAEKSSSRRSSASRPSVTDVSSSSASPSVVASTPAAAPLTLASAGDASPLALAASGPKIPADATHRAAYPFEATADGQLSYAFGDFLRLVNKEFEAWWRMVHVASGAEGLVAASYVAEISEEEKRADVEAFVAGTASPPVEASSSAVPASSSVPEAKPASRRGSETKTAAAADAATPAAKSDAAASSSSSLPAAADATHRASFPFDATTDGQLSYAAGDLLILQDKPFEAWWRFKHCATGQEGLVAATYVAEISVEERAAAAAVEKAPSRRSSASAAAGLGAGAAGSYPSHAALYAFTSGGSGQLDLAPAELVEVLSKEQPGAGWWTVRNAKGESGIVPANYLNPEPAAAASAMAGEPLTVEVATPSAAAGASSSAPTGLTVVTETPSSAAATAAAAAANPPSSRTTGINNPTHIGAVGYSPQTHAANQDAILDDIVNGMGVANPLDLHKTLGKPSPASAAASAPAVTPGAADAAPAAAATGSEQEAVALYAFTATEAGQLSIAADEIVAVVSPPEHAWFVARNSKGEVGSIPENYVRFQPATVTAAAAAAAPTPDQASAIAAFDASFPASSDAPQRRGTVMPGSMGSRGPPPMPSEKRHSVMSSSSSQGSTVLATHKPLEPLPESVNAGVASAPPARGAGPPPLSADMAEHVKRMSISSAAELQPTSSAAAAAEPAAASAAASSIPAGATHRASFPFEGTVEGQLSYAAGDYLALIAKEFEAWWRFKHCASGNEGLVAATYVAELSDEEKAAAGPAPAAAAVAEAKASIVPIAEQPAVEAAAAPAVAEPVAAAAPAAAASAASDAAAAPAASSASADLPFHVALYSFESTADGQLGITAGEALRVLQKDVYDGWWSVQNRGGASGMVPSNYLDPNPLGASETEEANKASAAAPTPAAAVSADASATAAVMADPAAAAPAPAAAEPASSAAAAPAADATTPVLYEIVMTYDYSAQSAAELSATKGSVLSVLAQAHPGWLSVCASPSGGASATLLSPPSQGVVPESFARRVLGRVRALYPYAADAEKGLLGLEVGTTILVVERSEDGSWGTGWIGAQTGLFPLNYVE